MTSHDETSGTPVDSPPAEPTVAIIGIGLIGGSIAAALRKVSPATRIIGVGRHPARLQQARRAGLLDDFTTDVAEAAQSARFCVLCPPVEKIVPWAETFLSAATENAVVTDAGSVKGRICDPLQTWAEGSRVFVGSHPMAGSEKQGFEHAEADLFVDRVCVVTPNPATAAATVDRVTTFWERLGSRVIRMDPESHDRCVARISHLPHVLASALAGRLLPEDKPIAATGFRDTTRIAAGSPDLWLEILLNNAPAVNDALDDFAETLDKFRDAIAQNKRGVLRELLAEGKRHRDRLDADT